MTNQAIDRAYKFTNLESARGFASRLRFQMKVIAGSGGKYWIAANQHDQEIILKAGYEVTK